MLQQLAKTTNPWRFPVQRRRPTRSRLAGGFLEGPIQYLTLVLLILFVLLYTNCRMTEKTNTPTTATTQTSDDVNTIHRRAITIDMHADTPQRLLDEQVDLSQRLTDGHFDSVRAREGGLDAQFFSIWVEPQLFGGGGRTAMKRADDQIAAVRALAERHPETWQFATTAAEIRRITSDGKLAALAGLEGGYAIDEKLENVERYYNLGVRYMSPAWTESLSWAGSSGDDTG